MFFGDCTHFDQTALLAPKMKREIEIQLTSLIIKGKKGHSIFIFKREPFYEIKEKNYSRYRWTQ